MSATLGLPLPHDAAAGHVSGTAPYVDDLPLIAGTLHAAVGMSGVAHGRLRSLELDEVAGSPGVVAVATHKTIPGAAGIGPVIDDEDLFAGRLVEYAGQALYAVAAETLAQARRAARRHTARIDELPAVLSIEQALATASYIIPETDLPVVASDWQPAILRRSPHTVSGEIRSGAQEHFYLEGQAAYAIPQEGGRMLVHSSSQHPSEIQHTVARVLGLQMHDVEVRVRRMGGGFGGKETQGALCAAAAALLAQTTGRPVKLRLPRADDFILTGKRHPFLSRYEVGFDDKGKILAADYTLAADCGFSADLSMPILDRALLHCDNSYHLPCVRARGFPCRTNKASNTAFRGFGGPQGMLLAERVIEDIARHLQTDPLEIRQRNLYRGKRQRTPYGQTVADNILPQLVKKLAQDAAYKARRRDVKKFNKASRWVKKGLALTPVKFGISFTVSFLNQAGALVQIYRDGTIALNHGGTEMGQGLYVKVAQVVADALGVPLRQVKCEATSTAKIPNTSATAASSGFDLNGKAAEKAALELRGRLARFAAKIAGCPPAKVEFGAGQVRAKERSWAFAELVEQAYLSQISLMATGYYTTPKLDFDGAARKGRPFLYYAYGAAVSEVEVDTLTGEHRLLQVDILHDVGQSANPGVDMGQIEGGFAQGMGWLTSEELSWNAAGKLEVVGPATYKIPAAGDLPEKFSCALWPQPNQEDTVYRSKAVGEPPLMLALSVWAALGDAVAAATGQGSEPVALDAPATPERVLLAIEKGRR